MRTAFILLTALAGAVLAVCGCNKVVWGDKRERVNAYGVCKVEHTGYFIGGGTWQARSCEVLLETEDSRLVTVWDLYNTSSRLRVGERVTLRVDWLGRVCLESREHEALTE